LTPVFIFSLPRSGSTLLQRLLATHSEVKTVAEPWVLLPLVYMTKETGVLAKYSHATSTKAINSFSSKINLSNDYNQLLSEFVLKLYKSTMDDEQKFFVDKTPRYYYIIDEIAELFPNAKFIFLFRNPVQVFASVLTTWCNNNFFKLYRNRDDLFLGPKLLSKAYIKHQNRSMFIHYEDLVTNNEQCLKGLYEYLGLSGDHTQLFKRETPLFGTDDMGDVAGKSKYTGLNKQSQYKWKTVFSSPLRKWYIKRYLNVLGNDVANVHGYDISHMTREINAPLVSALGIKKTSNLRDVLGLTCQLFIYKFKLNLLFTKNVRKNSLGFYD